MFIQSIHPQKPFLIKNQDFSRHPVTYKDIPDAVLLYIFKFIANDYLKITLTCKLFNNSMKIYPLSRANIIISSCNKMRIIFAFSKFTYENMVLKESKTKEKILEKCIEGIWNIRKRRSPSSRYPMRIFGMLKNKHALKLFFVKLEELQLKVMFLEKFLHILIFQQEKKENSSLETTSQDDRCRFLKCKEKAEIGDPKWCRLDAEQVEPRAQYKLGRMYSEGDGVPRSISKALKWYRLAAERGELRAQYKLGVMYDQGDGVPRSISEALKWYNLSGADRKYAEPPLKDMYNGVSKEEEENLKFAADNGDLLSQCTILCMFRYKQMSWLDEDKLIAWFETDVAQGKI